MEVECPASLASHLEASKTLEAEAAWGLDAGDVGAAAAAREASSAFGPVVSLVVSPVSDPPTVSYEGGRIALPFVERSTRCVMLLLFLFLVGVADVFSLADLDGLSMQRTPSRTHSPKAVARHGVFSCVARAILERWCGF